MTSDHSASGGNDPSEITTVILPPEGAGNLRIEFGSETHVGCVRPNNEDQFFVARLSKAVEILATSLAPEQFPQLPRREGYFFLVADGMGGAAAGEHASATVVTEAAKHLMETAKWFFRLDDPDENVRLRLLKETLERVDRKLIDEAEENPLLAGMGTTLTALSIIAGDAFIVQVGDSRAYLFRDGVLEQLTRDQTLVQELIDRGLVKPEAARTHRLRHVLLNVIGGKLGVEGQIAKLRLFNGDRLLLCTDGLNEPVLDDQIAAILGQKSNPQEACHALVEAALNRGGPDNVTVVVVACSATPAE